MGHLIGRPAFVKYMMYSLRLVSNLSLCDPHACDVVYACFVYYNRDCMIDRVVLHQCWRLLNLLCLVEEAYAL
jgi:hypothetical protein